MSKGTKRAVLVGCNYPKTQFSLHGCINDVKAIRDVILDFGFKDVNVLVDLPGSPVPPTETQGVQRFSSITCIRRVILRLHRTRGISSENLYQSLQTAANVMSSTSSFLDTTAVANAINTGTYNVRILALF
ncbi:hypothetical protein J1N35_033369 [Gossypium stocksii]|uniref:Peptidase C14 caspase domain-containing protein n=1 Tax=Gossypium stocksii TaxID=47602 RepID=A0A9D3UQU1_9ROSI|nr:hypothetical protein J1N35_033369 [Gossypium stocksii]